MTDPDKQPSEHHGPRIEEKGLVSDALTYAADLAVIAQGAKAVWPKSGSDDAPPPEQPPQIELPPGVDIDDE